MVADIPIADRSQQGIDNSMDQHIGVGMAHQPLVVGNLHATEDEGPLANEPMDVVADSDSHGIPGSCFARSLLPA